MRFSIRWLALSAALASVSTLNAAESQSKSANSINSNLQTESGDDIEPVSYQFNSGCSDSSPCSQKQWVSKKDTCGCNLGNWFDNTYAFSGASAFKTIADSTFPPRAGAGFMNSAGLFGGFNSGFRLGSSSIRGQLGASYGLYDLKGRDTVNPTTGEQQAFITSGIYKRSDFCNDERISWGIVYDQFWGQQYGMNADEVYLGQFRLMSGYALNQRNEIGTWSTLHTNHDRIALGGAVRIRGANQSNVYWKHSYDFGGTSMYYVGGLDKADVGSWMAGMMHTAPLSCRTSLYTNTAVMFPSSAVGAVGSNEQQWSIAGGLMYSFGGKAVNRNISGQKGMPLLPVANTGTFMITN